MDAESVGQIGLDLVVNKNGFDKQMSGIQNLAKKAAAALAGAFAVKKIVDFGKECLELGSDLAEVQNVVDVTFPSMASKVDEFAKSAISSFGLSETMAKQFAGTFGAMAKAFGFSEQQAYDMGSALTGLAGDVASFYNLSQEEAYTKLKSVFTGETESLKDLGVVMTQTSLDTYAMANGFGKATSAMSEAEKVALRYAFVQDQLAAAQGDFARTSGSWANQVRILKLQFDSLKATIGQGLINLFTPIIRVVNTLLGKLGTLANAFKAFTELITGNKSSGSSGEQIASMGTAAMDAGAGLESASGAADDMASSSKKAGNAAKQAAKEMRALMGFDQINKLSDQTDDDSGSGDSGSGSGVSAGGIGSAVNFGSLAQGETVVDKVNGRFDKLIKKAKELTKLFKKGFRIGFGDSEKRIVSIQRHLSGIGKTLKEIFTDREIINAIERLFNSITFNAGKVAGSMGNIALSIAQNFIGGIDRYLSSSKGFIKKRLVSVFEVSGEIADKAGEMVAAFADVFSVFGEKNGQRITASIIGIFSDAFLGILDLGLHFKNDIVDVVAGPFIENKDAIKQVIDETLAPIALVFETIWNGVQNTANKALEVYNTAIHPLFESLKQGLTEIAGKFLEWYNTYIVPVLDALAEKFRIVWEEHIQPVLDKVVELFGKIAQLLQAFWEGMLQPLIEWIITNILPIVGPILEKLGKLVLNLLATVSDVIGGIIDILGGIIDFLAGIFSGDWKKAFDGLQTVAKVFQEAIEKVFSFVKIKIFQPFDTWLSDIFQKDWTKNFGVFGNVLNAFSKSVSEIWSGVKKTFNGIITFIKGVFTGNWRQAWTGVKEAFGGVFSTLAGVLKSPLNAVIGLVNTVINKINSFLQMASNALSFDIGFNKPSWMGGGRVGFKYTANLGQIGSIPYLAQGGFVEKNTPRLAMIGDNRHYGEVVAPENKLEEMAKTAVQAAGNSSPEIMLLLKEILEILKKIEPVTIDEEALRKYFIRKTNKNTRAYGTCEIIT